MKILFVVQAYGKEVVGGAETHCRMMATRMAGRGHHVDVLTSCAQRYAEWSNVYEPGKSELDGVTVRRLAVDAPLDKRRFGSLSGRLLTGFRPTPLFAQEQWIEMQGPHLPDMQPWLWEHATDYDVVVFFTYLYYPTVRGLPVASGRVPTVLHPLSHDEPPLYLPIFDTVFKLPSALAFSVEEDAALAHRRFGELGAEEIIGIGTDLDAHGNSERIREQFGIGKSPYVVNVGRLDTAKGSNELYGYFIEFKRRNPGPLKLVLVGEPVQPPPTHDDIVVTGHCDTLLRDDIVSGATVSMHPSYFESFSMTLTEAWAMRIPAFVNGRCEVLEGQVRRSGGGLVYKGFAEFEIGLRDLVEDAQLRTKLGSYGRSYVEERYDWDVVMERYESFLGRIASSWKHSGNQS